ncbi:MAG: diadenylate cyclase CdaA [Candidatus Omnitrophica bacterium]|nr:diadenylate cyclase CdaA [Candidatus Omnitrophota bacterium]
MHNLILNWRILTEVVILWFVIYQIMLFFEGRSALQVLRGITILVFAFFIFQKFDFLVLNWLLKKLFGISVIALLIIFHPEIRQGLAQLGKRKFFKNNLNEEETGLAIKQIAEACENLAKNKLGGLIAIKKNDSLASYIQSGEIVDSRISANLIQAIFTPNNPLHDGGLIIQDERIAAASCILPLTTNQELSRVFGTRHRAALGLSEETDAIVIVVSEERCDISIIYRKRFYKDLSKLELESKIKHLIEIENEE